MSEAVQGPFEATVEADGVRWAVYRVDDDRARLAHIDVGRRSGLRTQIIAGLATGERVVMHPGDAVDDGVAVKRR